MATNCGFSNQAQCEASVSGNGGFCYRNPAYEGAARRRPSERSAEVAPEPAPAPCAPSIVIGGGGFGFGFGGRRHGYGSIGIGCQ